MKFVEEAMLFGEEVVVVVEAAQPNVVVEAKQPKVVVVEQEKDFASKIFCAFFLETTDTFFFDFVFVFNVSLQKKTTNKRKKKINKNKIKNCTKIHIASTFYCENTACIHCLLKS